MSIFRWLSGFGLAMVLWVNTEARAEITFSPVRWSLDYVIAHHVLIAGSLLVLAVLILSLFILVLRRLVKEKTAQLAASQSYLQATLDALPDLLFEIDAEGYFHHYHSRRYDLLGAAPEAFLNKTMVEVLPEPVVRIFQEAIAEAAQHEYASLKEYSLDLPQGTHWFSLSMAKKKSTHQKQRFIALVRDITQQKNAEQQLARIIKIYAALSQCNQAIVRCVNEDDLFPIVCQDIVTFGGFDFAWIGRVNHEDGTIEPVARYGQGAGYLSTLTLSMKANDPHGNGPAGKAARLGQPIWNQDFQHDPQTTPWQNQARIYGWHSVAGLPLTCEERVVAVLLLYSTTPHAFDESAKNLLIELAIDVSFAMQRFADERAHQASAQMIEHLANYDVLTELPNRVLLRDRVLQGIAMASRNQQPLALMFLDLDHFKNINDSLGHDSGDDILREVAKRLTGAVRAEDTVSRWGGDEFILLLPNCNAENAARVAEKVLRTFETSFNLPKHELNSTASIGIALYPQDGSDFEALAKAADSAMYRAKNEGRNAYRFFTPAMEVSSQRFLLIESGLRQALKNQEFFLHYQPQFSITDGHVIGAEALVRWQNPQLGLVSPSEFIPIAELSGHILPLGTWILHQAIRQAKAWQEDGLPPLTISVNLSAAQFRQTHLVQQIKDMLDEVNLDACYLELELTESLAMEDPRAAITMMDALHEIGITLAIDDFGTGYSSLAYLKRFRVSKLKIDQSFVRDIASDPNDRAIVDAIITMAHSLGFKTIAEGVETTEQLAFLREHGCHDVQGYYFSKPLPADEFKSYLLAPHSQLFDLP
jgi:diguanylate cyclase (GGDEF)-like protein/PAS domain S-box-containing protein